MKKQEAIDSISAALDAAGFTVESPARLHTQFLDRRMLLRLCHVCDSFALHLIRAAKLLPRELSGARMRRTNAGLRQCLVRALL